MKVITCDICGNFISRQSIDPSLRFYISEPEKTVIFGMDTRSYHPRNMIYNLISFIPKCDLCDNCKEKFMSSCGDVLLKFMAEARNEKPTAADEAENENQKKSRQKNDRY
jgi:hypothetical protein